MNSHEIMEKEDFILIFKKNLMKNFAIGVSLDVTAKVMKKRKALITNFGQLLKIEDITSNYKSYLIFKGLYLQH